jgi:hypothetical protein
MENRILAEFAGKVPAALFRPAGDDDARSFGHEAPSGRFPDAAGRACNDSYFPVQSSRHRRSLGCTYLRSRISLEAHHVRIARKALVDAAAAAAGNRESIPESGW